MTNLISLFLMPYFEATISRNMYQTQASYIVKGILKPNVKGEKLVVILLRRINWSWKNHLNIFRTGWVQLHGLINISHFCQCMTAAPTAYRFLLVFYYTLDKNADCDIMQSVTEYRLWQNSKFNQIHSVKNAEFY